MAVKGAKNNYWKASLFNVQNILLLKIKLLKSLCIQTIFAFPLLRPLCLVNIIFSKQSLSIFNELKKIIL